jgi:hypothetical protein
MERVAKLALLEMIHDDSIRVWAHQAGPTGLSPLSLLIASYVTAAEHIRVTWQWVVRLLPSQNLI